MQNKQSHGLPGNVRLHLKNDFEDIIKNGKKCAVCGLVLWWRSDFRVAEGSAKMGIVVSRRLGIAARRNRVKRLLREVFRLNRHTLRHGVAFVISPRDSGNLKNLSAAQEAVTKLWQKAGILKTQDQP